jgi:uncharacterized membrane protein YphA (DoxX/SURF4 family)
MKADLIAMVPRTLPRPDVIVFLTGIAEIAGAVGLLIPATRCWAACGLIVLLVSILPGNVNAAPGTVAEGPTRDATAASSADAGPLHCLDLEYSMSDGAVPPVCTLPRGR